VWLAELTRNEQRMNCLANFNSAVNFIRQTQEEFNFTSNICSDPTQHTTRRCHSCETVAKAKEMGEREKTKPKTELGLRESERES
jgi:hypothetical protein